MGFCMCVLFCESVEASSVRGGSVSWLSLLG